MRHIYTRIVIGIIWIIAGGYCLFTGNYMMTAVGMIAGAVYLYSAYSTMKKEKDNK